MSEAMLGELRGPRAESRHMTKYLMKKLYGSFSCADESGE